MQTITVRLNISPEEFIRLYNGSARNVNAPAIDGRRVSFPAAILRPFVTHQGIRGLFNITFDDNNKFAEIARI